MSQPIEAEGLVRHFGAVVAVDGVDLVVEQGEIFGFLGPNGAGKSTLVRMLTTLLKPTAGQARVAGHDVVAEAGAVRRAITPSRRSSSWPARASWATSRGTPPGPVSSPSC